MKDFHTYFVSNLGIWTHNSCGSGWIRHDTYNVIRNRFGEDGVNKFVDAMNKGLVSDEGENGIKFFSGDGAKVGRTYYKYEIKVKGKYGDWRVFGNYDEKSNQIIFDKFDKGKH